jgi:hypothetical protein
MGTPEARCSRGTTASSGLSPWRLLFAVHCAKVSSSPPEAAGGKKKKKEKVLLFSNSLRGGI